MSKEASRFLVVVRCGDNSLHTAWLASDPDWDLAISYYGANGSRTFPEAQYVHHYKGGKWDGIRDFFNQRPGLVDVYDYFWLPDDDILTDSATVKRMFELAATDQVELCQPSLSRESYFSHIITLNNPCFQYRYVNLVEIMVPVLSRSMMKQVLPLFENVSSGFGLDFVWNRFTSDPANKVRIFDSISVTHTRPVGGNLHKMIKESGKPSAREEGVSFLAPYGRVETAGIVLGGKLRSGRVLRNRYLASLVASWGWFFKPGQVRPRRVVSFAARWKRIPVLQKMFVGSISTLLFWGRLARGFVASLVASSRLDQIAPIVADRNDGSVIQT